MGKFRGSAENYAFHGKLWPLVLRTGKACHQPRTISLQDDHIVLYFVAQLYLQYKCCTISVQPTFTT